LPPSGLGPGVETPGYFHHVPSGRPTRVTAKPETKHWLRAAWKSKPPSKAGVDAVKLKQGVNEKVLAGAQKLGCALREMQQPF